MLPPPCIDGGEVAERCQSARLPAVCSTAELHRGAGAVHSAHAIGVLHCCKRPRPKTHFCFHESHTSSLGKRSAAAIGRGINWCEWVIRDDSVSHMPCRQAESCVHCSGVDRYHALMLLPPNALAEGCVDLNLQAARRQRGQQISRQVALVQQARGVASMRPSSQQLAASLPTAQASPSQPYHLPTVFVGSCSIGERNPPCQTPGCIAPTPAAAAGLHGKASRGAAVQSMTEESHL